MTKKLRNYTTDNNERDVIVGDSFYYFYHYNLQQKKGC